MDIGQFLEIEKKYNLYDVNIDGAYFWMYRRFNLWETDICAKKLEMDILGKPKKGNRTEKAIKLTKIMIRSVKYYFYPKRKKDILFVSHPRRVEKNGRFECIYTDKLSEHYGKRAITIEEPLMYSHMEPVVTENIIYLDYIRLITGIKSRLYKVLHKKDYNNIKLIINQTLSQALDELSVIYEWEVNKDVVIEAFAKTVVEHNCSGKLYRSLLKRINPKVMVLPVSYNYRNMQLIEIARDLGIKTVELQHGNIFKEHIPYSYAAGVKVKQFPDYVFVFSDFWKKSMKPPIANDRIISTGYIHFDEKLKKYNKTADNNRKRILFISQWTIGKELSAIAAELANILPAEYSIIYKLHPLEYSDWEIKYGSLKDAGIEVIGAGKEDLYDLFNKADIMVGVYSTAIYEGLGFGLKAFIYKTGLYESMSLVINEGYATLVTDAKDLADKIVNHSSSGMPSEDFWKSDAYNNTIEELDKLLLVD